MNPIIGVTANFVPPNASKYALHSIGDAYIQAVIAAGGVPIVIPVGISGDALRSLFARLDGLLLTGGGDIGIDRFGGLPHPRVYDVDERRDDIEISLVKLAVDQQKPFLGICRGIQVINVALGGTLFTDIGDQLPQPLKHDYYPDIPRNHLAHTVSLESGSRLAQVLGGDRFEVNSLHHQGINHLSPSLKSAACAPDGLVEAVEIAEHPFAIGVQWHPEWLQEHAPQRSLFQAFIQAAAR